MPNLSRTLSSRLPASLSSRHACPPPACPSPRARRRLAGAVAVAVAMAAAAMPVNAQTQARTQSRLPVIALTAGMYAIQAEVAADPASRELGLMYRKSMPANSGMLFVFEQKAGHCFWMKNTELPLSIAFLADDGTIVNIEDMRPRSEDNHCPRAPVRYALEMNQGWFAQKGIRAGAKIGGLPALR